MSFITSGRAVFSRTIPYAVTNFVASNPTTTTIDLEWDASLGATSYSIESSPATTTQTTSDTFLTFPDLTPGTAYTFTITPSNTSGNGPPTNLGPVYTLINPTYLSYTGTIETMFLPPGNYNFELAGGSGPLRSPVSGGGRCYCSYTNQYTLTSPITIQYAIGQASPGDRGGAGGTYVYDQTNSQWLFVAGGAGTNTFSPVPDEDPGDGSGGAAGSGGGSGAGVNSNGSNSTESAGSGGLTFGNGAFGGIAGTFGTAYAGGFGGGGGGTILDDVVIGDVYYPGGGGGYTGGTTTTIYTPEFSKNWVSTPGTSYAIGGSTIVEGSVSSSVGGASVTDGRLNIIPV